MFNRFRRASAWGSVVKHYHRHEFPVFLERLREYETTFDLSLYERALKGAALLMSQEYEASAGEFCKLSKDIGEAGTQKERYLSLYASAMIDSINGKQESYEEKRLKAIGLKPGLLIKTMLPL